MKKLSKFISAFLVCVMAVFSFAFVGCKSDNDDKNNNNNSPSQSQPVASGKFVNFASNTNNLGECEFFWNYDDESLVDNVKILVNSTLGEETFTYQSIDETTDKHCWKFSMQENVVYNFTFTSYLNENNSADNDENIGETLTCSRMNVSNLSECNFSRVEIETEDYVWPTCKYVSAPAGCWGAGITNAKYVQSKVSIYSASNELVYASYADADDYQGAKVKVRGNTSAYADKKPYKIKISSKADLLSSFVDGRDDGKNYKNKNWLLLAGGSKITQMVGSAVAETVGVDYVAEYEYVYLIVNGDFRGIYILSEAVSQGNGSGDKQSRVAVSDSGYIIEQDAYWWNEDLYFETPLTENYPAKFTFKYPDTDDIDETSSEYLYIKNYMSEFETALKSGNGYLDYIDAESFAQWILSHNYLSTWDSGGTNIYFYKYDSTDSSKLCMGPLWDFDSITGCGIESNARIYYESVMFGVLFQDETFLEIYKNLFNQTKNNIVSNIEARVNKYSASGYNLFIANDNARWGSSYQTLEQQKASYVNFMNQHIDWLDGQINV